MKSVLFSAALLAIATSGIAGDLPAPPAATPAVYYPPVPEAPQKDELIRVNQYLAPNGVWYSNVCNTPVGSCFMASYGMTGSPCWCPSPSGPIQGTVGG